MWGKTLPPCGMAWYLDVEVHWQRVRPHQLLHQVLLPVWDFQLHIYAHTHTHIRENLNYININLSCLRANQINFSVI